MSIANINRIFRVSGKSPAMILVHFRQDIREHEDAEQPFNYVHKTAKTFIFERFGLVYLPAETMMSREAARFQFILTHASLAKHSIIISHSNSPMPGITTQRPIRPCPANTPRTKSRLAPLNNRHRAVPQRS